MIRRGTSAKRAMEDLWPTATGFCDSNYFLKLYKRKFGISAGKARRKNAGSPE